MKLRHHPRSSTRARGTAAALVACVLSLLVTPVALAEPLEGDLLGSSTATTDRSWEHRNDLEFLNQHDKAAQASVTRNADALRLQRHLELGPRGCRRRRRHELLPRPAGGLPQVPGAEGRGCERQRASRRDQRRRIRPNLASRRRFRRRCRRRQHPRRDCPVALAKSVTPVKRD